MTQDTKELNPIKQLAIQLAHQMDDEKQSREEFLHPIKVEEIRDCGKYLRELIFKSGYDIHLLLRYSEEYKTLSMAEYQKWIYI